MYNNDNDDLLRNNDKIFPSNNVKHFPGLVYSMAKTPASGVSV